MDEQRRSFLGKVKGVNTEKFEVNVIMSDASVDRYREVIHPDAWKNGLSNYKKHPVLVSSHAYHGLENLIGKAKKIKVNTQGQLETVMQYFVGEGNAEADWGFKLAEKGMAAYSVGFIPKAWVYRDSENFEEVANSLGLSKKEIKNIRLIFTEVELLENSQVIVPANANALQNAFKSDKVQNDPFLKETYENIIKSLEDFKEFFETEDAAAITKSFEDEGEGHRKEPVERVRRSIPDTKEDDGHRKEGDADNLDNLLSKVKDLSGQVGEEDEAEAGAEESGDGDEMKFFNNEGEEITEEEYKSLIDSGEIAVEEEEEGEEGETKDVEDKVLTQKESVLAMALLLGGKDSTEMSEADKKAGYDILSVDYKKFGKEVPEFKFYETMEDVATGCKDADTALALIKELSGEAEKDRNDKTKAVVDMVEELSLEVDSSIAQIKGLLKDSQKQIDAMASHIKVLDETLTELGIEKIEKEEIETEEKDNQAEKLLEGIKGLGDVIANKESSPP